MVNPTGISGKSWDFGFSFHRGEFTDSVPQLGANVGVVSNGEWFLTDVDLTPLANGRMTWFNTTPGGTNTLDLVVDGITAYFGLNGHFVAKLDLPRPIPADVIVGTGYFPLSTEPGRVIAFKDFRVWPLPALTSPTANETPAPLGTPAPMSPAATPGAQADDAALQARFADLLAARAGSTALADLPAGELTQDAVGVATSGAGVTISEFSASVTVINPAVLSGRPWDFGSCSIARPTKRPGSSSTPTAPGPSRWDKEERLSLSHQAGPASLTPRLARPTRSISSSRVRLPCSASMGSS